MLETIEAEARDEAPISVAALHDGKKVCYDWITLIFVQYCWPFHKENEEAKAELVRQFTELQSNKVRLESELVPLQGNIDRLQDEVRKAEELRQALYASLTFAFGVHFLTISISGPTWGCGCAASESRSCSATLYRWARQRENETGWPSRSCRYCPDRV